MPFSESDLQAILEKIHSSLPTTNIHQPIKYALLSSVRLTMQPRSSLTRSSRQGLEGLAGDYPRIKLQADQPHLDISTPTNDLDHSCASNRLLYASAASAHWRRKMRRTSPRVWTWIRTLGSQMGLKATHGALYVRSRTLFWGWPKITLAVKLPTCVWLWPFHAVKQHHFMEWLWTRKEYQSYRCASIQGAFCCYGTST